MVSNVSLKLSEKIVMQIVIMRRLLLLCCLFVTGIGFALYNFQGLATKGQFDSIAIDFREDLPKGEIESQLKQLQSKFGVAPELNSKFSVSDNLYIFKGNKAILDQIKSQDPELLKDVESIEPNYIYGLTDPTPSPDANESEYVHTAGAPNDPLYNKQWHMHNINVEQAWETNKGSGIVVAVIDTGVTKTTDMDKTEFVAGYDFVNNKAEANDDNGHGTHVAGSVAQSTNNSIGVAGVAYQAKIMPLKVLSAAGGGTVSDIAESIKFAADKGANVINMSLGGGGESALMKEAIDYAHAKGVVIVAAAGNENQGSASYPARYNHVIGVAAFDAKGEKAEFSNFGAGVDIAAPGGGHGSRVWQETIDPDGGAPQVIGLQGTSMASPHVAGVAAMIMSAGVKDPDAVQQVLQQSVRQIAEDPLNHFGAGQLDAGAAVLMAARGQISFSDFFRWLHENGYLNLRFWFDGGAVALLPKILMVLGSYMFAFLVRYLFPSVSLATGLITGSSGLFFMRGFYMFDLPQAPFRMMGSSLAEMGNAVAGNNILNPLFASVLIPAVLLALLWSNETGKRFSIGLLLGTSACLAVNMVYEPHVWMLGDGLVPQIFLGVNAALCFVLARFAARAAEAQV
jgi:serine protease